MLLSCAYDRTVIVWKYQEERELTRFQKPEELRCMDYLSSTKTLFVGTNQKSIITIPIEDLLSDDVDQLFPPRDEDVEVEARPAKKVVSPSSGKPEAEDDLEEMRRKKQALLNNLQLGDDDPLKKLLNSHD